MEKIFKRRIGDNVQLLTLKGPLEGSHAEELQMSLIEDFDEQNYNIALDISQVTILAAGVLRIISWASEVVANNQGRMIICGPSPEIYEKFETIGLEELVEIVPDLDFAKELFDIH